MTPPRKGRPTKEEREKDAAKQAIDCYHRSRYELETGAAFADAAGVRALKAALPPGTTWTQGVALDLLRRGAVQDILAALDPEVGEEVRLAVFIRAYFLAGRTIADLAASGELGRTYHRSTVSKGIAAVAELMVASRLLLLLENECPHAVSEGVRAELETFTRRHTRVSSSGL